MPRWIFLICLPLVLFLFYQSNDSFAQTKEQRDHLDLTLGLKAKISSTCDQDVPELDNGWSSEGNLFAPVLELHFKDTTSFLDRLTLSLAIDYGKLKVYDSHGASYLDPEIAPEDANLEIKRTQWNFNSKFRFIPCLAAVFGYEYREYEYWVSQYEWTADNKEKLQIPYVGLSSSYNFGESSFFVYGKANFLPYIMLSNDNDEAMGFNLEPGFGVNIFRRGWVPLTTTLALGYYYEWFSNDSYTEQEFRALSCSFLVTF